MKRVFYFLNLPNHQIPDYQKFNLDSYPPITKLLPQKLTNFFRAEIPQIEALSLSHNSNETSLLFSQFPQPPNSPLPKIQRRILSTYQEITASKIERFLSS